MPTEAAGRLKRYKQVYAGALGLKSVFSLTKVPLASFFGLKCSKHTVVNRFLRPGLYSLTYI